MRRAPWFLGFLLVPLACSAHPEPPPRKAPIVLEKPQPTAGAAEEEAPLTPANWMHSAEEADKRGEGDVANACRGRAYKLERDTALLGRWVDGLVANRESGLARQVWGEERRTAQAKGDAALVARLDAVIAGLPGVERPSSIVARGAMSAELSAAYRAEMEGRAEDAIRGFSKALEVTPAAEHLAHAGSLRWRSGDVLGARREWSRARVLLREVGARFELVPVNDWFVQEAAWTGERLVLQRIVEPIEPSGLRVSEVQSLSAGPSPAVALSWYSESKVQSMALSEDGGRVLLLSGSSIVVRDSLSGVAITEIETGESETSRMVTGGVGDGLLVLAAAQGRVRLWDATGKLLDEVRLEGTAWAVSLALSPDLRFAAIGGSDSKVRLLDRKTGKTRLLAYAWKDEDGKKPDPNVPLDMRFSEKGDRLVVVHREGDLITWGTADGRARSASGGRCSKAEASAWVNDRRAPGELAKVPSEWEMARCGRAVAARIEPGLKEVATTGVALRIRNVNSGVGTAFFPERGSPSEHLAWSRTGTLAMLEMFGGVRLWSAGDKAVRSLAPPLSRRLFYPSLSSNGRFLSFEGAEWEAVWDPVTKKPLDLRVRSAEVLSVAEDGSLIARRLPEAVELVEVASGGVVLSHPVQKDDQVRAYLARGGKRALLRVQGSTPRQGRAELPEEMVLCDVQKGGCGPVGFGTTNGKVDLSGDGRWIVAEAESGELSLWGAASGKAVVSMGKGTTRVAFANDGSAVAWIEEADRDKGRLIVNHRRLGEGGAPKPTTLEIEGSSMDIAVSPDGAEVWILLGRKLHRWRVGVDKGVVFEGPAIDGAQGVRVSDDARVVFLRGWNRVALMSNDDGLRLLGKIYPLLSGGFLAVSAEGAVDGTEDAPESLVTRVTRAAGAGEHSPDAAREKETLVLDGRSGWDAAHVDGVFERMLAGKSVEPKVPGANGGSQASP